MMEFNNLWSKLEVDKENLESIRRDWSEGKVPELPYQIIGQQPLKDEIGKKLKEINGNRMSTTVLRANYGDGKTNALKYLELYFRQHADLNVKFVYCRANPDQTDLCMFLMRHIEASFKDILLDQIMKLRTIEGFAPSSLAYNFQDDFAFIKEYVSTLFDTKWDEESTMNLIYLGTGRLYSRAWFNKYGLNKLTDFNRREIFVLFMNIIASAGVYIFFAIDELEKINDKSAKRMAYYFTSFRELLDLFGKINGHYMISAITKAVDIESICPPLHGRLTNDFVLLNKLSSDKDLSDLVTLLSDLLGTNTTEEEGKQIAGKLKRNSKLDNNRRIVQKASELLMKNLEKEDTSVEELLVANEELKNLYEETKENLISRQAFSNLSRTFFDPLAYYLYAIGFKEVDFNMLRRDYQSFLIPAESRAFMFLFNDGSKVRSRIEELHETRGVNSFVVFVPEEISLSYAEIAVDGVTIQMQNYNPEQMFVLLNMYRMNFDKQSELSEILSVAFNSMF